MIGVIRGSALVEGGGWAEVRGTGGEQEQEVRMALASVVRTLSTLTRRVAVPVAQG